MEQILAESRKLFQFLPQQLPRLKAATLESHQLKTETVLVWALLLIVISACISMGSLFTKSYSQYLSTSFVLQSILQQICTTVFTYAFYSMAMGFWVKNEIADLKWSEWNEFFFMCWLPALLSATFIFLPVVGILVVIAGVIFSIHLLYNGLKNRFRFQAENPHLLIGVFVIFSILNITPMISLLNTQGLAQ